MTACDGLQVILGFALLWGAVELALIARSVAKEHRLRKDAERWRRTWGRR